MTKEKQTAIKDPKKSKKDKDIKVKESDYLTAVEDAAKYKDQYLRLFAEFENARKRMDREKAEFAKYANEGLITEFLAVMDDLHRSVGAAKAKHQDYEAFLKGIEIVMRQIDDILRNNNVKPIETVGKKFDPHYHEVLMQDESDEEEGTILEEYQKGFLLGDKVVRTAKVRVAKKINHNGHNDTKS